MKHVKPATAAAPAGHPPLPGPTPVPLTCICDHIHKEVEGHYHLGSIVSEEGDHQLPLRVDDARQAADAEDIVDDC